MKAASAVAASEAPYQSIPRSGVQGILPRIPNAPIFSDLPPLGSRPSHRSAVDHKTDSSFLTRRLTGLTVYVERKGCTTGPKKLVKLPLRLALEEKLRHFTGAFKGQSRGPAINGKASTSTAMRLPILYRGPEWCEWTEPVKHLKIFSTGNRCPRCIDLVPLSNCDSFNARNMRDGAASPIRP